MKSQAKKTIKQNEHEGGSAASTVFLKFIAWLYCSSYTAKLKKNKIKGKWRKKEKEFTFLIDVFRELHSQSDSFHPSGHLASHLCKNAKFHSHMLNKVKRSDMNEVRIKMIYNNEFLWPWMQCWVRLVMSNGHLACFFLLLQDTSLLNLLQFAVQWIYDFFHSSTLNLH